MILKIFGQCEIKHISTLPIKTITSIFNASTVHTSRLILSDSQGDTSNNVCLDLHSGRCSIYMYHSDFLCYVSDCVVLLNNYKWHYKFLLLSFSQLVPLNMWGQVQLYALTRSLHVPPFSQGVLQQSLISCEAVKE